ncbi:MAG: discoidin domain-containing protein [Verrucomicrobia bacterium]|nr:discoidin domain-containing protein [Verrucomicrobiota bacterium]
MKSPIVRQNRLASCARFATVALLGVHLIVVARPGQAASMRQQVEADWLRQAEAWAPKAKPTEADAAGAVDGVKHGKYAFHTAQEPNPWWQVDLGEVQPLTRLVVFNRLDYAPGLHNADHLRVLASDDGQQWRIVSENRGRHFGGVSGVPPLDVKLKDGEVTARFVRLQIPSATPVFFHLDEVEIFGPADPAKNLALQRPADQSSVSMWSTSKLPPLKPSEAVAAPVIRHFIERGHRLAVDLEQAGVRIGEFTRVFDEATARLEAATRISTAAAPADSLRDLYFQVRWAMRRLAFRNPRLDFDRLLFVKRFCQETYPDVCLNHMPWVSRPGGDLCILTLAGAEDEPAVRNILQGALGPGHVHGMDLSWDGQRIVFGYAKARSSQPPEGWLDRTQSYRLRRTEDPIHLFEIGVDGRGLRQLTSGEWSDLDPTYAPNGDVVFVSERCGTSLQCNEYDKDETSCNLYVMRPDGSGIRRLSANKDGDYLPHTLDDGTIGYTRWEYHERSWAFIQSLWTLRPDGTQADAIFKQHFVNPWALEDVRSIPGTRNQKLVCVAAGHHTLAAGPVVVVTPGLGINEPRGMSIVTPGVLPPEGGMDGVPAAEGGVRDQGGYYMHPWPLSEKTFLAAYTYGTGKTGVASEVDPSGYALYLIDVFGTKELLHRDPAISCFTPIPLRARLRPPVLPDLTVSAARYATCVVSTVSYGCDGIAPERIRWLRLAEPIGWPYDNERGGQRYGEDHRYGGPGAERKNLVSWTPIRILGDVPVEKDGSVKFRVPADTAVYFQLLDEDRMELRRMRSFISFQPGEQRACTGCHESRNVAPVPAELTTSLAMTRSAVDPEPPPWGDRPVSFLRDIQPILDRHCVSCHCGLKPAGGLDFFGGLTSHDAEVSGYGYNRAYETILEKGLVAMSGVRAQDASITPPLAYGSTKSKLAQAALRGRRAGRYNITDAEWRTLAAWIDANAPYHDRFVNKRAGRPAYDLAGDKTLLKNLAAVHERRCASCHRTAEVTRLDWIDFREPARSLFLTAPLAKDSGGRGKCSRITYQNSTDPDYRAARDLVEAAVRRAWENPRRDMVSLERRGGKQQAAVSENERRVPVRE